MKIPIHQKECQDYTHVFRGETQWRDMAYGVLMVLFMINHVYFEMQKVKV